MPRVDTDQTSFNAGEISPLMYGQVTLDKYKNAMAVCLNMIPLIQGPVTRRGGTYFVDEVRYSFNALGTRTVAFKFSTIQAYDIEMGNLYVRFKKQGGPVHDVSFSIATIVSLNPLVITYTGATDPITGDDLDITGVIGMTQLNSRRFRVGAVNPGSKTLSLNDLSSFTGVPIDASAYSAYISGGTMARVYTVVTPYAFVDLFQLKFTQSADTFYITHPSYPPATLSRTGDASWTYAPIVFLDGPYMQINAGSTTMAASAVGPGAGITLTLSSTTGVNNNQGWLATDVGRFVRTLVTGTWGYALITSITSNLIAVCTVINAFGGTGAVKTWRLGLYSANTGYPACPSFFNGRLWFGGCPAAVERLDGSKSADYLNFAETDIAGTVTAASAVNATLDSNDVQAIFWMLGNSAGLVCGTSQGEWLVSSSSLGEAISSTNITAKQSLDNGCANIQPCRADGNLIYLQHGNRKVREISFLYYENKLKSKNLSVLAEHITKGSSSALTGIREVAYQQELTQTMWGVRLDGVLLGMTYSTDDKVEAWHRHILGGFSDAGHTLPPVVESMCVIQSIDSLTDTVYLVVKRFIGNRIVRYNEYMQKIWERGDAQSSAFFVDAGITYSGTPTLNFSGLNHLAGETIQVLADGATVPDVTVDAFGNVTLPPNFTVNPAGYSTVNFGYGFNSDGQTLRPEAGSAQGTAQGKLQRNHRVAFRLHDSLDISVGPTFNATGPGKLTRLPFRTSKMATNTAVPLFSGDKTDFVWESAYSTSNYVCFRFDQPLPGTVISIMPRLETQDGG
jgi:hypothetical protein